MKVLLAYILDLVFGDPRSIPHPVRIIGWLINLEERVIRERFDKPLELKIAGLFMVVTVVGITFFATKLLLHFVGIFGNTFKDLVEVILIYTTISVKELAKAGKEVAVALELGDIELARSKLAEIVSRDTYNLEEQDIIRGAIESLSENINDGIVAPIFYSFIGGAPLAMAYKAINTLDSMVGYKKDIYLYLGYFPAKIDDIANFIPARLSGIFIVISTFILGLNWRNSFKILMRDRLKHESPNSAHGMAAVSGALGIRLGGPTSYNGRIKEKPYIGDKTRDMNVDDIYVTARIVYVSSFVAIMAFLIIQNLWRLII